MNRRSFLAVLGIGILARKLPGPNAYVTDLQIYDYQMSLEEVHGIASPEAARRLADVIREDLRDYSMCRCALPVGTIWARV